MRKVEKTKHYKNHIIELISHQNFLVYLRPLFPLYCQPIEVAIVANKLIWDGTFEKDTTVEKDLYVPL